MPPIDDNLPPAKGPILPRNFIPLLTSLAKTVLARKSKQDRSTDDEMPLPDSASLLLWILVLGLLLGAAKSDGEIEEEERASGNKKKSGKLCELANLGGGL